MKKYIIPLMFNCLLFLNVMAADSSQMSWHSYRKTFEDVCSQLSGSCPRDTAVRMMNLVYETKPDVYVEIGVYAGRSFVPVTAALAYNKKGLAYAIDSYIRKDDPSFWGKIDPKKVLQSFMDSMHQNKLDPYYFFMPMTAEQALPRFSDGSIDILHIDANTSEHTSTALVTKWCQKVKKGGYILFANANLASTKKATQYLLQNCSLDASCKQGDPSLLFKKS